MTRQFDVLMERIREAIELCLEVRGEAPEPLDLYRSHASRGNASGDALRRGTRAAERPRLHSHAERGND